MPTDSMNINGYFVKIVVHVFSPDNLDIKDAILLKALNNFMSIKMIPDQYTKNFQQITSKLNTQLLQYSLATSIGSFLPEKAYIYWMNANKQLIQKFINCKNDLIASYDSIPLFIKDSNIGLIKYIWEEAHPNGGKPHENFIIENNNKLIDLLPSKEDLYNSINIRLLIFKITDDAGVETQNSNTFLVEQIKNELINAIADTFDKIINFYNNKKQIKNDMLEFFKRELSRIELIYFCGDVLNIINLILEDIKKGEHIYNKSRFIANLNSIKIKLIEEVKKYS